VLFKGRCVTETVAGVATDADPAVDPDPETKAGADGDVETDGVTDEGTEIGSSCGCG